MLFRTEIPGNERHEWSFQIPYYYNYIDHILFSNVLHTVCGDVMRTTKLCHINIHGCSQLSHLWHDSHNLECNLTLSCPRY